MVHRRSVTVQKCQHSGNLVVSGLTTDYELTDQLTGVTARDAYESKKQDKNVLL